MQFSSAATFLNSPRKAITLLGMSGVGKTTLANKLPRDRWFHYSGDYRIGTRYMGEVIEDNLKQQAMTVPLLATLLRRDAMSVAVKMSVDDLSPLSTYLGKPGRTTDGGLPLAEFRRRQQQHHTAEIQAMLDVPHFISRATSIYGYPNFINDAGGSAVEVIDLTDPHDPVLRALTQHSLILYIRASEADEAALCERAAEDPKPMYYAPEFLDAQLPSFLKEHDLASADEAAPDAFARWTFPKLIRYRRQKYETVGTGHGYAVTAAEVQGLRDEQDTMDLIAAAIDRTLTVSPSAATGN